MLWDEFVDKNHDRIAQSDVVSPPLARVPNELTESTRELSDVVEKLKVNSKIPPKMERIYGYWDKYSRKWISYIERCDSEQERELESAGRKTRTHKKRTRKTIALRTARKRRDDIYDQIDETDSEFETSGLGNKRMSLREFRCKRSMNKNELSPTSSHSDMQ